MNIFKFGYYRGSRNIWHNIRQFFRNFKYAYQRCTKGYCDMDVWNLDSYYAELFTNTLKELADTSHGYPGTGMFEDSQAQVDGFENGYDRWQKYLYEMAEYFARTQEDYKESSYYKESERLYKEYQKSHLDMDLKLWLEHEKSWSKYREGEKDKAFEMMKPIFFNLWD